MEISNPQDDPKTLMGLAKAGDTEAFGRLYQLHFVPVFRYIYFRVRNKEDAEDLVQTVFLKTYQSITSFREQNKPLLAYLFTIARNTVIDYWKAKTRKEDGSAGNSEIIFEQMADDGENPADIAEKGEIKKILHRAIAQLTEEQQEVVTLKFMSEMSNKEIASLLGKTEEAVRQLQCRGLKALRQILKRENIL